MSDNKKKVTIFGAGVAGLTAAHELAVRGFKVTIYDPQINEVIPFKTLDRGIGGMARSQFAVDTGAAEAGSRMVRLRPAADFLLDATLELGSSADEKFIEYPEGSLDR